jgi:hypothetical protein
MKNNNTKLTLIFSLIVAFISFPVVINAFGKTKNKFRNVVTERTSNFITNEWAEEYTINGVSSSTGIVLEQIPLTKGLFQTKVSRSKNDHGRVITAITEKVLETGTEVKYKTFSYHSSSDGGSTSTLYVIE